MRAAVPAASSFDPDTLARGEGLVADVLRARSPAVVRRLRAFLRVLEWLPVLRTGRRLSALDPERACGFLARLARSRVGAVRQGVWGVRTLAFMAAYGTEEGYRRVGYAADAAGWEARGGPAGPWPGRAGAAEPEGWVLTRDGPRGS